MKVITKSDTYDNSKILLGRTINKLVSKNIISRHKIYDHGSYVYTINVLSPLAKSVIWNYDFRSNDFIINNIYRLTREEIQIKSHIYKVNTYIFYTSNTQFVIYLLCLDKYLDV